MARRRKWRKQSQTSTLRSVVILALVKLAFKQCDSPCHFQLEPHAQNVQPTLFLDLARLTQLEKTKSLVFLSNTVHNLDHIALSSFVQLPWLLHHSIAQRLSFLTRWNAKVRCNQKTWEIPYMAILKGTKWHQDWTPDVLLQLLHTLVLIYETGILYLKWIQKIIQISVVQY